MIREPSIDPPDPKRYRGVNGELDQTEEEIEAQEADMEDDETGEDMARAALGVANRMTALMQAIYKPREL
jgi:hypothetical protein